MATTSSGLRSTAPEQVLHSWATVSGSGANCCLEHCFVSMRNFGPVRFNQDRQLLVQGNTPRQHSVCEDHWSLVYGRLRFLAQAADESHQRHVAAQQLWMVHDCSVHFPVLLGFITWGLHKLQ